MREVVALGLMCSLAVASGCQTGQHDPSAAGAPLTTASASLPTASAPLPAASASLPTASAPLPAAGPSLPAASAPLPAGPPQPAASAPQPAALSSALSSPMADSAAGEEAPAAVVPAHVKLPLSPATPPRRTSRRLDRTQLRWLAAVAFPEFDRQDRSAPAGAVEVRHVTQGLPRLGVTVTIGWCSSRTACPAMKLAPWTARRNELLGRLPQELRNRPDTRFEIGAREISGAPAIYTYQLGYSAGTDAKGRRAVHYSDAYVVYYNDGVNQIRVMAHYLDDAVSGIDELLANAPQDELEKLAVAFASFYVHAWN